MNATIKTNKSSDLPVSRILKVLVLATYASLFVAASSGAAMIFVRPPEGDSLEGILGITAAISGMAIAAFGSSSVALLFRWRKWTNMPIWAKLYTAALPTAVVVSWLIQIVK
jgi:hypothetical protein